MMMNVRLFGRLADLLGEQVAIALPAEGCSIADMRQEIARSFPDARTQILSNTVRAIVGDTVVGDTRWVTSEDRVEFFPPVSGG